MKIKCMHCETIYFLEKGACVSCGGKGGYMQEPSCIQIGDLNIHLEETFVHKESNNEYQIKEIQTNGFIAKLVYSPIVPENAMKGKQVYISKTSITEYSRK